VKLLQQESGY